MNPKKFMMKKRLIQKRMILTGMLCTIMAIGVIGCGKTNEVLSESDAVYSNLDNEASLMPNEKQEASEEENDSIQEETSVTETSLTSEAIPAEYPDEEMYGSTDVLEKYYTDENGNNNYHFEIYQYIFSDLKYQKVNDTLRNIYEKKESEYKEYYESNGPLIYNDDYSVGYKDYEENIWFLVNLTYVGDDYISILFNDADYWPGSAHPMSYFSPVTIDVNTGEIVDVEDILGYTWSELSQELREDEYWLNPDEYGFYLAGEEVHFIYRFNYFVDEIVVPREGRN